MHAFVRPFLPSQARTVSLKRRADVEHFVLPLPKRIKLSPEDRDEQPTDIGNMSLVARIMKTALPDNAKIAKEAKECMQECVSEFISFITSEGMSPLAGWQAPGELTKSQRPKSASMRNERL